MEVEGIQNVCEAMGNGMGSSVESRRIVLPSVIDGAMSDFTTSLGDFLALKKTSEASSGARNRVVRLGKLDGKGGIRVATEDAARAIVKQMVDPGSEDTIEVISDTISQQTSTST